MTFQDLKLKTKEWGASLIEGMDKNKWFFIGALFLSIFLKLLLFTKSASSGVELSCSYDSDSANFFLNYAIYIGIPLLFVGLGLCSKHYWAAFTLNLILDIWIFANLISLRSHGMMITGYDFRIASNMDGFWDSIFVFIHFWDLFLFIITGVLIFFSFKVNKEGKMNVKLGLAMIAVSIVLIMIKPIRFHNFWGLQLNICDQLNVTGEGRDEFAANYTVFSNLIAELDFYANLEDIPEKPVLSGFQKDKIRKFMIKPEHKDSLQDNLIIIMFESLEGWVLNKDINGQEITPNINALTRKNSLYGSNMMPQTQRGTSSDAQLTVNTGLLSLVYETVCYAYPTNKYYSIGDAMAQLGSHNVMRIPTNASAWNQGAISGPWGYPTLYSKECSDEDLFYDVATIIDSIPEPFCIQAVTMASHAPFWKYAEYSSLEIPDELPASKINYIKSVNYTDKCIGEFLEKLKDNPKMKNTTIVIVGDHSIFNSNRQEFAESELGKKLGAADNNCVSFVIYSPKNIKGKEIKEETYHMDIYPTLLSLFKLNNYPWRGFGCDLTQDSFPRKMSEREISGISETIIRSNFFAEEDQKSVVKK